MRYIHYVALATALALSSIAAFFSVVGLAAIFPASSIAILVMASALEVAKVVCAVYLHLHWTRIPRFIKSYLCGSVVVLMCITSMGVFGFLSSSHLANRLKVETGVGEQVRLNTIQASEEETRLKDIQEQLDAIDNPTAKVTELSKSASDARSAVKIIARSKGDKDKLLKARDEVRQKLTDLRVARVPLDTQLLREEAEVGPIKYVANLIYGEANKNQLERAVRWLIIVLVVCFDPLAIAMILGTNIRFEGSEPLPLEDDNDTDHIRVHRKQIVTMGGPSSGQNRVPGVRSSS